MKIILFGYGKMGKETERVALSRGHEIALKIDVHNASEITKANLQKADVAIEFTTPETAVGNILKCFDAELPVVVGTTGWHKELEKVKNLCYEKNGSLFFASNFSIGVNIFFRVNEQLAKMMSRQNEYNVSIEETHHRHKIDTPSGTAISLANQIIRHISRKTKWVLDGSKKENELNIVSKREGEIPGTHIVKYTSAVDELEIRHTAHSRRGFALGAVLAAEFLQGKKGIYGMEDLMKL